MADIHNFPTTPPPSPLPGTTPSALEPTPGTLGAACVSTGTVPPETGAEQKGATGVMGQVKEKAQEWAGTAKEKAQEWTGAASEAAGHAGERVQQWASTAADKAGDFGQDLTNLIRRYPYPALLVGFGIGLALGQLVKRS